MTIDAITEDDFAINSPRQGRASVTYINEAGVPEEVARSIVRRSDVANAMDSWMQQLDHQSGQSARQWDLFNRRGYSTTDNVFRQMVMCQRAVEHDDVLSTIADATSNIAFADIGFDAYDEDIVDIFEQVAEDCDLLGSMRKAYRELFKVSQVYVGVMWAQKIYKVRTKPSPDDIAPPMTKLGPDGIPIPNAPQDEQPQRRGNRTRRKPYPILAPSALTVFDPTKILPVGTMMFGRERFAYIASRGEHEAFTNTFNGEGNIDPLAISLFERKYTPTLGERQLCNELEVNPDQLWLFKKDALFRHTLTRADYERWASLRLKGIFEILDMKGHLRSSDRAALVGATNFIIVIRKGTDKWPAKRQELAALGEQARVVAKMPVLIGDHRLSVEILTPKLDHTLQGERWDTLDDRLMFRALETFSIAKGSGAKGSSEEVHRVIASGLTSKREDLGKTFRQKLLVRMVELNEGVLDEKPELVFHPRRVTLDFNADVITAVLQLRDRGDISRESTLDEVGFDQRREAMQRARERVEFDGHFQSAVPHSSPDANPYGAGGGTTKPDPTAAGPTNSNNPSTQGARGGRPRKTAAKKTATATAELAETDERPDPDSDD